LLEGLELDPATLPHQMDTSKWDDMKKLFTEKFLSKTRDEWAKIFLGTDACVSPVLTFAEAPSNEHIAARGSLIELDGVTQHAPAPRFSRTPTATPAAPAREATDIDTVWT
jgi:alpha-methylacyl-CoA racemase